MPPGSKLEKSEGSLCFSLSQTFLSPSDVQYLGNHHSVHVVLFYVVVQVRPLLWLHPGGRGSLSSPPHCTQHQQLYPVPSFTASSRCLSSKTSLTKDLLFSLIFFKRLAVDFVARLLLVSFPFHVFIFLSLLLIFSSYYSMLGVFG